MSIGAGEYWTVTHKPVREHLRWVDQGRFLFASPDWACVTEALGATPTYAWNRGLGVGVMVPVFRRSGLKVGFFGFPVAGQPWDDLPGELVRPAASQLLMTLPLHVLRRNESMVRELVPSMSAACPEVWITDLQCWAAGSSKRLRRDLSFARRASREIRIVLEISSETMLDCYRLYAATVRAHSGTVRYTSDYFRRLGELARTSGFLDVFCALDPFGVVRGFAVLAINGTTAYYLHGATDEFGRRNGISDLLLEQLTLRAREKGASQLSLMASPWSQFGLVKFKRKWGNTSGLTITQDLSAGMIGKAVGAVLQWKGRHDLAMARQFLTEGDTR